MADTVAVHRGLSQLFNQLIIGYCAHSGTNNRNQLRHFCQVDIITILLLKSPPVELLHLCRKSVSIALPLLDNAHNFISPLLTRECQLENIENKQALF